MDIEKKRAVIKAALLAATAGMAVTSAASAKAAGPSETASAEKANLVIGDVPWGEVIIGPIWEQKIQPKLIDAEATETRAANPSFWKW